MLIPQALQKKITSNWVKDINIRLSILKLLQEKVRSTCQLLGKYGGFLNVTLEAQEIRPAINKCDLTKLNSFYTAKETMRQIKGSPQNGKISLPAMYSKN